MRKKIDVDGSQVRVKCNSKDPLDLSQFAVGIPIEKSATIRMYWLQLYII